MERHFDLLRTILLRTEASAAGTNILEMGFDHEFAEVAHHVELLVEAGLLKAQITYLDHSPVPVYVVVERLTWTGHEMLDLARDDGRWNQVLARVGATTGTTSFEIVRSMLEQAHHRALGRPVN